MMNKFKGLWALLLCTVSLFAQQYQSLDNNDPINFHGDFIVYGGDSISLGPHAFFIDGRLEDGLCSAHPYVFNTVNEAAEYLSDGNEADPMVLYIAPWVYWIDNPDDPEIRLPEEVGGSPFGLSIDCEWIRFQGLNRDPGNVILACNRGQTMGAKGNFTMFKIIGNGTSAENITFGNYCNVDLEYPLEPSLGRRKRGSAIVQAQLVYLQGDKISARNTYFISRLNLLPFYGGKRTLFHQCHFESTDDALAPGGIYLDCSFDFYSSKPFGHTSGTGAVFLDCKLDSYTRGEQYLIKGSGQMACVDSRMKADYADYWGWRQEPGPDNRYYHYNNYFKGEEYPIGTRHPQSSVDMSRKQLLNAYRFKYDGRVYYNTYNLLQGEDDWDPMGIKQIVIQAEKEMGTALSALPVQVLIDASETRIETGKDTLVLRCTFLRSGGYPSKPLEVDWAASSGQEDLVSLLPQEDGSCMIIPRNLGDESVLLGIHARTSFGLEASRTLLLAPEFLDPPAFSSEAVLGYSHHQLELDYKLDSPYPDQSLISWYRCSDKEGSDAIKVAVSRFNVPKQHYKLGMGDVGYFIKAEISPVHQRCLPGDPVSIIFDRPISASDVGWEDAVLDVDLASLPTENQPEIMPGFWSLDCFKPEDTGEYLDWSADNSRNPWYYGPGINGASADTGLVQAVKGARIRYTPPGDDFGDMKITFTACPAKTAGQGFSSAKAQYMDVFIKFDTERMNGYALRLFRTTKYHDAIDCMFMEYRDGRAEPIGEALSTTCYRTPCYISLETRENKIMARLESPAEYYRPPGRDELLEKVEMEAEIVPNSFGGMGFQHTGSVNSGASLIKDLSISWKNRLPGLKVSGDGRKIETKKGEPFFWLGDTGWLLLKKLSREEAGQYLQARAEAGFNVIQLMVIHSLDDCTNYYGDSAFTGHDIGMPLLSEGENHEYDYWDHLDYLIETAAQHGLYLALVPIWGSNVRSRAMSTEQAAAYGNFLAARYGHYSNVIWLNGGDTHGNKQEQFWNALGLALKQGAPAQLRTFHPFGRTRSADWFHNAGWLDFNMFQSGHRRYDQDDTERAYGEDSWRYVRDDYLMEPPRPTLDGEPSYEGIPQGLHDTTQPLWNDDDLRRYAYWSVFSGACGFTYGHREVMQFFRPGLDNPAYGASLHWNEAMEAPGAQQMQYLKKLMLSGSWEENKPEQDLLAGKQGERYDYIAACRSPGRALLYTWTGRPIKVNMNMISGNRVKAAWFNPRTGEKTTIGTYDNEGIRSFDPPGPEENGRDWVLILGSMK